MHMTSNTNGLSVFPGFFKATSMYINHKFSDDDSGKHYWYVNTYLHTNFAPAYLFFFFLFFFFTEREKNGVIKPIMPNLIGHYRCPALFFRRQNAFHGRAFRCPGKKFWFRSFGKNVKVGSINKL